MPRNIFDAIENRDRGKSKAADAIDFESERECTPTDALPGSEEKIAVFQRRLLLGQHLYHEQDRRYYEDEPLTPIEHIRTSQAGDELPHPEDWSY